MPRSALIPWSLPAGAVMSAAGVALAVTSQLVPSLPLLVTVLVLAAAAACELATGESLRRHHANAISHLMSAALVVGLGAMLLTSSAFSADSLSAAPVALMLGVLCVAAALFRWLEVAAEGASAPWVDALDIVATLLLGVVLLSRWRSATTQLVGLTAGLEVFLGGISVARGAYGVWHPPSSHGHHLGHP